VRWAVFFLFVLALALPVRAARAAFEPPPPPTDWVTDSVNFLSEPTRASLNSRLDAYAKSTGHQVLVWIGDTTGDVPLEEFANRSFERWKIGRKGIDDGVGLFVLAKDRKVRIEVGYGLEDKIPDVVASRIIREQIVPRLRADDHDGAITAGVEAIVARIEGKLPPAQSPDAAQPARPPSLGETILLVLGLVAVIIFLATHPTLASLFLWSIFSGGGRGGGGFGGGGFGGGGGFSGGGGRSGGGGASGSW
jgi:uncharacterized protein